MSGKNFSQVPNDAADSDPIYAIATEWLIRLDDPKVTPEDILEWQSWMREDASHAEAFRRIEEVEEWVGELARTPSRPPSPRPQELARDTYDGSVPIRFWRRQQSRLVPSWALAASVVAAVLALAVLGAGALTRESARDGAIVASTQIGENRSVHLSDGSTVTLGGDSKIAVRFGAHERHIDLLRGEAFFAVAKDPHHPLKVAAGRAVVIDVGTKFDVRRGDDQVMVDVLEGRVIVMPRSSFLPIALLRAFRPKLVPVALSAGEKTTVDSTEVKPASPIPNPEDVTDWISGWLAFRMQPLGQVLKEVNRYSKIPIVMADKNIATIRVTGTVVTGNVSGWVASLHTALGIVAIDEPDRIVLYRAGSAQPSDR